MPVESSSATVRVPPVKVVFPEEDRREILAAIDRCLSTGMLAQGEHVKAFEEAFAAYCRVPHGIACASGGAALEILMRALPVHDRDVLVPTNTFIATANAVIYAGGRPVFVDTDRATMSVTLAELRRRATPRTSVVCVVHIGGVMTPEMPAIAEWCASRGIALVEDAAHAQGSEVDGRRAGEYGVAAAYSFFATKVMTSGEGGAVVTRDQALADHCRRLRDYGKRSQWESVHHEIGANYRMSEIDAILAHSQLRRLDEFIAARERIAERYRQAFAPTSEVVWPSGRSSWYKFTVYLPAGISRDKVKAFAKNRGVSLAGGVYDVPLHRQPVFESMQLSGQFPIADDVCGRHICLPLFPGMTDAQIEHTIQTVREALTAPEAKE